MKNQKTLIIACLAAATAGVAIGMLLAPEKGEDLRKNVKTAMGNWADKLNDLMKESRDKVADVENDLTEEASVTRS